MKARLQPPAGSHVRADALWDADQRDIEDQRRIRGDGRWRSSRAIAQGRWDDQAAHATNFHAHNTLLPACNDRVRTRIEVRLEWCPTSIQRRIKHGAIENPAGIVDGDGISGLDGGATSHADVDILEATAQRLWRGSDRWGGVDGSRCAVGCDGAGFGFPCRRT